MFCGEREKKRGKVGCLEIGVKTPAMIHAKPYASDIWTLPGPLGLARFHVFHFFLFSTFW